VLIQACTLRKDREETWTHSHGAHSVSSPLLSFIPRALLAVRVLPTPEQVTIEAGPRPAVAECPDCRMASERIHSVYGRVLHDLPWQGRPVAIRVTVRRFRCSNRCCPRQTFAERLTEVARRFGRKTGRLRDLHYHLGLALGGEAGARLAARLAIPTSPDTLLRLVSARSSDRTAPTPRVLGIDDWAWRRGHRYGTVLVDLETNEVVDLLLDREAATVAAWLRNHPGVEIVARDRASAYADGVRQGAPGVVQVADRWHLLRNLGDAVQALTDRFSAAAGRAAEGVRAHLLATASSNLSPARSPEPPPTAAQRASEASRLRRQARYEEAARLHAAGVTVSRIAAELGAERKTVRRWLRLGQAPMWKHPARESILRPFVGYLQQRWSDGCRNGAELWRELRERGFGGRPSVVRRWAGKRRQDSKATGSVDQPPVWPAPKGFRLARLLMSEMSILSPEESLFVTRLLGDEPGLCIALEWAKRLNAMLRHKAVERLDDVLTEGAGTMLGKFAAGMRRDFNAINAALELPWTTSPVEGQITRIKMLKRTMYGRAGFELLRARVLHAA